MTCKRAFIGLNGCPGMARRVHNPWAREHQAGRVAPLILHGLVQLTFAVRESQWKEK